MLLYGDAVRAECPRRKLAAIADACARVAGMPAGVGRHAALVAGFIEAGELAQGIADAEFRGSGQDRPSPGQDAAMALLLRLAVAVRLSWESGFARLAPVPGDCLRKLAAQALPDRIASRQAEGFAFYALYPEAYLAAALGSALGGGIQVIGIRSIGAPLGAMVAAAIGAPPPVTVRPVGHPFRRELAVSEELATSLLAGPASFAVVDEGPGLSGSSFGAVADWLEGRGVPPDRIAFFPGHGGAPGPQASERHCRRWAGAARHLVPFGDLLLRARRPEHRIESWMAGLLGAQEAPMEEVSGGHWRRHRYAREADWPPVHAQQERRKFLLRAEGESWLLKFTGLGREGERKAERAQALAAAGFAPPVAGWRHGFLVERWFEEAHPLPQCAVEPGRLTEHIGCYLGFRARSFPAAPERGASLLRLWEMARHNTEEALGPDLARRFDRWAPAELARLAVRLNPVETDNRLHAWEWLVLPDGRILKCDATDHHAAHDLVGCQDIAWDVAGAVVELDLPDAASARLRALVERGSGRTIDPRLLALLMPCYLAFQLGYYSMAAEAAAEAGEAVRLRRMAGQYVGRLRHLLLSGDGRPCAVRPGSLSESGCEGR
ncbi:MAG: hypothetical protein IRY87_18405 [Acetobacteraceae bacterium]|nr:hypothetical protein [Acetobacteraceae bacterium]